MPIGFAGWALVANSASSIYAADQAREASRDQMAFQAGQTGSSYQRGVADMRAAGINPILAAQRGGAQSGTGAMPSQFLDLSKGVSSAIDAKRMKSETNLMDNQAAASWESKYNLRQDTELKNSQMRATDDLMRLYRQQEQTEKFKTEEQSWSAQSARWRYEQDKAEGELSRDLGEARPGARLLMEILRGLRR